MNATDPPKVQCTLSVACSASSSVVSPLKVKPRNGVNCQSALAIAGVPRNKNPRMARTRLGVRNGFLEVEAEEQCGEQ